MLKRSISEYQYLASALFDVGYFNPEKLSDGAPLMIVDNFTDAIPLEDENGAAVFFNTDDESQLRRFQPLFDDFPTAFVLIADKKKRDALSDSLQRLFPNLAQYLPKDDAFGEYKTLRDLIDTGGDAAIDTLLVQCVQKAAYGLINVAKIKQTGRTRIALSGIRQLDRDINGFGAGELSVWTGTRGSGKSTLIGQILLNARDQDINVFAYSGELTAVNFYNGIVQQAAGGKHVYMETDPYSGKEYYLVNKDASKQINEWLDGRFFLYDNTIADSNDVDTILSIMQLAAYRYSCKMFLVDNLMTARFKDGNRDFYREQSEFVGRLVEFAKRTNTHVHLVAHPRKTGENAIIADDVGGSGDITNRADNVFSIKRIVEDGAEFNAGLSILKNRYYGVMDKIKLDFDGRCNRFYELGSNPDWRYGWDKGFTELPKDTEMPF